MAITKGAKKAIRSSENKRLYNDRHRRSVKKILKEVEEKILNKDKKGAESLMSKVYKELDKAAKVGVLKKNTASRKKSRLSKAIVKIGKK